MAGLLGMLERRYKVDVRVPLLCILAAVSALWCLQHKVPSASSSGLWLGLAWGLLAMYCARRLLAGWKTGVFLLDFSIFPIPKELRVTREQTMELFKQGAVRAQYPADNAVLQKLPGAVVQGFTEETLEAHRRVFANPELGIGDATGLGPGIMQHQPFDTSLQAGLEELEMACYKAVEGALDAAGVKACEVDIVLTAVNMIVPIPSFSAMVAHKFGMRSDLVSYSLGGQGCGAGVLILGLAESLLKASPGKVALVVVHESTSRGFSYSNNKGTAISNCLFRLNGAAIVLSSRPQDRRCAKYELLHTERTLLTTDVAFNSIKIREDEEGVQGVFLQKKELNAAAGQCIRATLRKLAPLILPWSELARVLTDKAYKPNLGLAIDHILIHTGAALVISSVAEALQLGPKAPLPSMETLERFGNTSVCSTYYILANIESKVGVRAGERILQLGFGSGFKCAAAYWRALRDVRAHHAAWDPYN